ncbi:alpha-2-macroglobulin family protein [uncultured Bacteroides sp.]|uniref:alpha-2-macroglobulin family protein n=1 Tax=uncultured Bacteroides sp. TaxID=162156 RepID=UPI002AA6DD20|nr:alpha-2-macroglobulin family protein [uncultured Bacteroides sp.]
MNIKLVTLITLLISSLNVSVYAQSYDRRWKQLERAEKKDLPQTVIKLAGDIFDKAEAERNSPQMLKAYMWRMKYQQIYTPDSFYTCLKDIEQWTDTTTVLTDRAILNSLAAGIYADYAAANQWQLRQRTNLEEDSSIEDIREWSGNLFVQKVLKHTRAALQDSLSLLKTSSASYVPFVEQGKTSTYYKHDLYHLLALRGVTALKSVYSMGNDTILTAEIVSIYTNLINTYRNAENEDAVVLSSLDSLRWAQQNSLYFSALNSELKPENFTLHPFVVSLDKLISTYKQRNVCAEVYLEKAQFARNNNMNILALQLCDEAISSYPKYFGINSLKNLRQEIMSPSLSVVANETVYPDSDFKLKVNHRNIDGFTIYYYRVNLLVISIGLKKGTNNAYYKKYSKKVASRHFALVRTNDYLFKDTVLTLTAPAEGAYLLEVMPDGKKGSAVDNFLYSTRFKVLSRNLPDNQLELVALDAMTGHPVPNALIRLFDNEKGEKIEKKSLATDVQGKLELTLSDEYDYLAAEKGEDTAMPLQNIYRGVYTFNDSNRVKEEVQLLTDRTIYRPGQTVYIKGIAYNLLADTASVLNSKSYTLTLTGSNGREIENKKVQTNDFGSFTAEFVLPSVCLNGTYYLKTEEGSCSIRVEEYKRPTFNVTFSSLEGDYQLGDSVQVKGLVQTYTQVPLQGAAAKYTITRSSRNWWRSVYEQSSVLASGEVESDANGIFSIPLLLQPERDGSLTPRFYTYKVEVSVTNEAGETQTAVNSLMAGDRSLLLSTNMPDKICKDDTIKATFEAKNLNNKSVNVQGEYKLYAYKDNKTNVIADVAICSGPFTSNEKMQLSSWQAFPSGVYKLVLTARDDKGREVNSEKKIVLFSVSDTRPAEESPIWYYPLNTFFDKTHPASFVFGTSEKEAYVMMDTFSGNKRLESKILNLSDSVKRFDIPYKAEYGDGLSIVFGFVKNGQLYQQQVRLEKKMADKQLKVKWDVFRDKLRPGQKEEWKLTITTPQGLPAAAELLATMYDTSLDDLWENNQDWNIHYSRNLPSTNWMQNYQRNSYYHCEFPEKWLNTLSLNYDSFIDVYGNNAVLGYGTSTRSADNSIRIRGASSFLKKAEGPASVKADAEVVVVGFATYTPEKLSPDTNLRSNFVETAFFYPQLLTNEKGEVAFSFTMPESLTSWNFRGYAHTKGMLTQLIEDEVVASKEFMITPNLPRFVRIGDQSSVAASVTNLTEKNISGVVKFVLFDPMTEKVIATQKQSFIADAGKTVGTQFSFTATDKYDMLGCRLVAEGDSFSDGEQHVIPVLSNKQNITETMALPIRGNETRDFSLKTLFNQDSKTATNRKLTVEFTSNPAWYAIQALPALSLPVNDNAISWAAAYYANAMASYIVYSQPKIKAVFDSWKSQGGTKETLISNLQKNQEVKNILLEESPWLLEAANETQQKERIATLFDLNNIRNKTLSALTKLKELQLSNGSWTWYKGMDGSRDITNFVVESLARFTRLTGMPLDADAQVMQKAALNYLHAEALIEYNAIRSVEKSDNKIAGISVSALEYLYLITLSDEKVPDANKAAYNYFLSKIDQSITSLSLIEKAHAAMILHAAGRVTEAQNFIASLKEYAVRSDEQGMHFAFNESPYVWNSLRVPAHVAVMEAFEEVSNDSIALEEMKLWLLKQKQTQQWSSPVATVDAVYALLLRGSNLLENQGKIRIILGDKEMDFQKANQGIGYMQKVIIDAKTIEKASGIRVEKSDKGIAWGAVYAQYREDMDKVVQQGKELNVEKKLYVEHIVKNTKQLNLITSGSKLLVGDKVVVRLTIRLNRPMDFVQLKDQHASCFEPVSNISGYRWNSGIGYYVDVKDASTNFFFNSLKKGVYVLEYVYRVNRAGMYEAGLAAIQSAYAPEYASHSASTKVEVIN